MAKKKADQEPKAVKYPPPIVKNNRLVVWDYETDQKIEAFYINKPKNWTWWQRFLEDNKSFRYEMRVNNQVVSFTAMKELRRGSAKNRRPDRYYWYAHKKVKQKLYRKYLGYSDGITTERLLEVALKLADNDLPEKR